jgi:hypothetical protein
MLPQRRTKVVPSRQGMAVRRFRNVGAGIGLAVLLVLSFRLVDVLSVAAQTLQVDVAGAFAASNVPGGSMDSGFQHHQPSLCCDDFVRGGQLVLAFVLLSGLPMTLAAFTVALATTLRTPRRWPPSAGEILRACFVLQWSSLMLSTLLTLPILWIDWRAVVAEWQGVFLLATMAASALALPAWRLTALAVNPAPISILGRRPNGALQPRATNCRRSIA